MPEDVIVGEDPDLVRVACARCGWEGEASEANVAPAPAGVPRLARCPRCEKPVRRAGPGCRRTPVDRDMVRASREAAGRGEGEDVRDVIARLEAGGPAGPDEQTLARLRLQNSRRAEGEKE